MKKRIILIVSLVIFCLAILGSIKYTEPVKNQIKSILNNFKPTLRVAAIGRHGQWLPGNIQKILETKYNIVYVGLDDNKYDLLFVSDLFTDENFSDKEAIKIYWTSEAYIPNLDHYDLVIGFNHIDSPKFIRLPYYYTAYRKEIAVDKLSRPGQNQGECNPNKPLFACFLVSNGSTDYIAENGNIATGIRIRDDIFHELSKYKWVASGGKHLNNINRVIPRGDKESREWLGQCKFVIAYENQLYDGYITEKVFQAYFSGAVPIYWGDKSAVSDVNKDAIIYANDSITTDDLISYIKKVDKDDDLYCKIWNQALITNHELNYDTVHDKLAKKLYELIDSKLHQGIVK